MPPETNDASTPDPFFNAEFGEGDLAARLWAGGLRADEDGYSLRRGVRALADAVSDALDARDEGPVSAIVSDVEACWEDHARIRRFCHALPGVPAHAPASLARVLLSVDALQPPLVTALVNKLSELGSDRAASVAALAAQLLAQLRWLNFLVDGPALCEALLAIVPVVAPPLQRAIVEALPEVLDDAARPPAVAELVRLLQDSPALTGSIIDALSALGVDDAALPDVNASVLSTLPAASRDILPVCMRYLLRTCPASLQADTVAALRATLALPSLGAAPGKLCLDAVKTGLRLSRGVADHVLKVLRGLQKPDDHKPADLWLLLALLDSPLHRKTADAVFRRKAGAGALTPPLVHAALAPFAPAFHALSPRLVSMAAVALRGADVESRRTGVFLYAMLFRLFETGDTRRAVVSALLDHTGTRRPAEADAALEALATIAREAEDDRALLPHSATIQGLLDFLEFFSDAQIRQIWCVLGHLCRASVMPAASAAGSSSDARRASRQSNAGEDAPGAGGGELQMLEILLRKELTHADTFYRRIGVIGACTMIKVLGNKVKNKILDLLLDVGRSHPLSQALAFDELAEVFGEAGAASKETAESIRKTVSRLFEARYVREMKDLDAMVKDETLFPAELYGNLDDGDIDICFSFSAHIRNEDTLAQKQDSVRAMIPNLRLLCVMTASRFDGSLAEVDAIIGSALHLPLYSKEKDLEDASSRAKEDLLLSLFMAHGWIVELINAFAEQETDELRARCVKRVDNLLDLRTQISAVVPLVSRWSDVIFDAYSGTRSAAGTNGPGLPVNGAAPTGKKKRGPKAKERPLSGRGASDGSHDWARYGRQLSPTALTLIRILNPITIRYTETESEILREGNPSMEKVSLSPKALHYLLSELSNYTGTIVGPKVKDPMAFAMTMFPPPSAAAGKANESVGQASTNGPLQKLATLRVALESVGPQLKQCVTDMFTLTDDEDADVQLVETYRACAICCLQIIATTLNSKIFSDRLAQDLLFDILVTVRLDGKPQVEASEPLSQKDIEVAAKVGFEQLRRGVDKLFPARNRTGEQEEVEDDEVAGADLMGLEGCCAFLAAMNSLYIYCSEKDREELGEKFSKTAMYVLKHRWSISALRVRKASKLIAGLVRIHVQTSTGPLKRAEWLRVVISDYAEVLQKKDERPIGTTQDNAEQTERAPDLASLTEHTSHAYNVAILEQYLALFKEFKPDKFEEATEVFDQMDQFMRAELPLYQLAVKNQRTLGVVMRAGRSMTDLFLKKCVPFLKTKFTEHTARVVQVCKLHQKPTRLLQSFCAHTKSLRETSLTGLVPPLRRTLELLLYRVKEIYQVHNATEAFEMGNLKHRTITGDVVSSQEMQYAEEAPADNDNDDEDGADAGDDENGGDGEETDRDEDEGEPRARLRRSQKAAVRGGRRSRLTTPRGRGRGRGAPAGALSERGASGARPPRPPKPAKRQKIGPAKRGGRRPVPARDDNDDDDDEEEEEEEEGRVAGTLNFGSDVDEEEEPAGGDDGVAIVADTVASNDGGPRSLRRKNSSQALGGKGSAKRRSNGKRGRRVSEVEEGDEDDDNGDVQEAEEDEDEEVEEVEEVAMPIRKRKRKPNYNDVTQRKRNPLIDDEAGDDGDEEEEDGNYDLSQFIEFGDEEET